MSSPQGPSSQSKRSQTWSESWHDATQSDRASDANLTPSSANSESTNHDSLPTSVHDRTMDFADNSLDGAVDNDRPAQRTGSRSSSRSEFIRSSLERNRACQAILRKQMSDSLWRSRANRLDCRCLSLAPGIVCEKSESDLSETSSSPEIYWGFSQDSIATLQGWLVHERVMELSKLTATREWGGDSLGWNC